MVAVRKFDEQEVLQKIMEAFWREGYRATSIDDIVAATGLKRGSLYGAFGDKEAMFLQAYRRYGEQVEARLLATLEAPDLRAALQALFDRVIVALEDPTSPPGCLVANGMSEAAGAGAAIEAAAKASFARAESAFYERLLRGQAEGEIAAGKDLRALARFLTATLRGMALVHRLNGDRKTVEDIAKTALERID